MNVLNTTIKIGCKVVFIVLVCSLLLTACLYPDDRKIDTDGSIMESINSVQFAVNQFIETRDVPPIQNIDLQAPYLERYRIDFRRLSNGNFISRVPTTAFENGGSYIFVLVNVDENPMVRVYDLLTRTRMNSLQNAVNDYMRDNQFQLPAAEMVADYFYYFDYDLLGIREQIFISPYSGGTIQPIMHISGIVGLDYAPDLVRTITAEEYTASDLDSMDNIAHVLFARSPIIPVASFKYLWIEGQPVPYIP